MRNTKPKKSSGGKRSIKGGKLKEGR